MSNVKLNISLFMAANNDIACVELLKFKET